MADVVSEERLDQLRTLGDDLADRAVAEVLAAGQPLRGDLVAAVERVATPGSACRELLDHVFSVPAWVDFGRMLAGARVGLRHAVPASLALLLGSLVESYGAAKGAKVLIRSGQLQADTLERLHRTAGFILHISQGRGPRPGSPAHRQMISVRLVHALVRRAMLHKRGWEQSWGHPVNQEDYASTLMLFCHVTLRSMGRLGVRVSAEEEDSVHHTYRWVGHVMGVHPDLLTRSRAEEMALYQLICHRQLHPDDDGRTLAQSLILAMAGRPPLFLPAGALYAISRLLVGDRLADAFGFPPSRRWGYANHALRVLSTAQHAVQLVPGTPQRLEDLGERFAVALLNRGFAARA